MMPILNCDNCGACCFEQGSPPGYLMFLDPVPPWAAEIPADDEDRLRFARLPAEAKAVLQLYAEAILAGIADGDGPCVWLDEETNRCRWYAHRPQICRDFEPGSEGCRCWRDEFNVDVEALAHD
jgi:uncharacterized protein